jgi:hypothetical protein
MKHFKKPFWMISAAMSITLLACGGTGGGEVENSIAND